MKTVLAPNAPWPYKPEAPKPTPVATKRVRKMPAPNHSKRRKTDAKFAEWASKNLVVGL